MESSNSQTTPTYDDVLLYRAISVGFLYPTTQGLERLKNLIAEIPPLEELQEEHFRLFGPSPRVYNDLAFYFSENPFEQAKKMADMAGYLRAFGVEMEEGSRADNISVCFEFLSYLNLKLLNAKEKGMDPQVEITQNAIKSYTKEFLVPGVIAFQKKLSEQTQNRFYIQLGEIALESIIGG